MRLGTLEKSTLENALRVAAERFEEHSTLFKKLADQGGNEIILADAAAHMCAQFKRQAEESRVLLVKITEAHSVSLGAR